METLKYTFIQHEPVTWERYALHNENKEFIDTFLRFNKHDRSRKLLKIELKDD